jgi:hypothetical protein
MKLTKSDFTNNIREYSTIEGILQKDAVAKETIQFYKMSDSDSMPIGNYMYSKTGKLIENVYGYNGNPYYHVPITVVLSYLESNGYTIIWNKSEPQKGYTSVERVYEKVTETEVVLVSIAFNMVKDKADSKDAPEITVYGTSLTDDKVSSEYGMLTDILRKNLKTRKLESNNISLVITNMRGYDTTPFTLPKQKINISLNYGKQFEPIHKKIITELNKENGKGLVLLHGLPGTGKTHYLKYLASSIKNKKVLFIPPHMADFITSPEMTSFLIDNANSVLFIEDAERVITDRTVNGSTGVSNILNITDGILSDILNIQVVATFNMDKRKIDSALLRKGRLIAEHKFDVLPKEDAQILLTHLGHDVVATAPMTLTEIYNINDVEYKSEDRSVIGFR